MDALDRLFGQCQMGAREAGKAIGSGCRRTHILCAFVLGVMAFLAQGQAASATTITVNTTSDELNVDGNCSLREAIQAANTDTAVDACPAGSGTDTIVVPAGTYTLSIAGAGEDANATGDLDITADLTIIGAGAATTIVDGTDLDRVFDVHGVTVSISGVTIQNGNVGGSGAGILNRLGGSLTVTGATVTSNVASETGGGIRNDGTATLVNVTISDNVANAGGGFKNGFFAVSATLTDVAIDGNTTTGDFGGGISKDGGTLTMSRST